MLDTKLKNRHKLAVFLILLIIIIPAMAVLEKYGEAFYEVEQQKEESMTEAQVSDDFVGKFVEACYIFYNRELSEQDVSDEEKEYDFWTFADENNMLFEDNDYFETFLDYRVVDEKGSVVAKTMAASSNSYPGEGNLTSYSIGMRISFDGNGVPSAVISSGEYKDDQSKILIRQLGSFFEETELGRIVRDAERQELLKTPVNRTFYLAMRQENMEEYLDNTFAGYVRKVSSKIWWMPVLQRLMS